MYFQNHVCFTRVCYCFKTWCFAIICLCHFRAFTLQKCWWRDTYLLKTFPHLFSFGRNLIFIYVTNFLGANTPGLFPSSYALFWVFLPLSLSSGRCSRCTEMEPPSRRTDSSSWMSPSWMQSTWSSSRLEFWITWSWSLGRWKHAGMGFMPWTFGGDPCCWPVAVWTVT